MPLTTGTKLGPYEILSPLGAGGMGEVYRARDTKLDRDVAVKVLPEEFAGDPDRLARFEREAKAVAALSHPNILAIFDFGEHDGIAYAVTELLEGETLRERLAGGALPQRKAVECSAQTAQGLAAAHEKGIIHRDVKPENLFTTLDGRIKILDFGLARQLPSLLASSQTASPTLHQGTEPGALLGTSGYMSPEQVRGQAVDHRSDIFSLGVVLYEMLTGQRAFRRDSAVETMNAILKEDPPEPSATGRLISPNLERVVRRCLEKNPSERFQSARDLAFALESSSDASTSAPGQIVGALKGTSAGRNGRVPLFFGGLFLLATASAVAFLIGRRGSVPAASPFQRLAFTQRTFRSETIFNARFSPNGQTIVYSAAATGNEPELFAIQGDYPEPRSLGLGNAHLLSISSKGEMAVLTGPRYLGHRLFEGTLGVLPLGGQAVRSMLENVREADWSPDGSRLAVLRTVDQADRLEYPIGTVLYHTPGYLSDVRVSPRGDRLAFFEHPLKWDDRGSVLVVDASGKSTTLATGFQSLEGLAWAAGGSEVIYSGTREGGSNSDSVFAVDLQGRKRALLSSPGWLQVLDILPDGRGLFSRDDGRNELWTLAPGAKSPIDLSWFDAGSGPFVSDDGRRLLFTDQSNAFGPNYAVCLRGTDGSPPIVLGEGEGMGLSPDGRWALAAIFTTPPQLVLYPTGPGERRTLDVGPLAAIQLALWLPDGKHILVTGNEAGHAARIYQVSLAGGPPRPVTPEGVVTDSLGSARVVAPDGRAFVAQGPEGRFALYPADGSAPRPLPGIRKGENVIQWTPDGATLFIGDFTRVPARVEKMDVKTGARTPFMTLAPSDAAGAVNITGLSFSADGRSWTYDLRRRRSVLYTAESRP
ncbi:MAG: protein kinase [Acidobacteriota bacterium]